MGIRYGIEVRAIKAIRIIGLAVITLAFTSISYVLSPAWCGASEHIGPSPVNGDRSEIRMTTVDAKASGAVEAESSADNAEKIGAFFAGPAAAGQAGYEGTNENALTGAQAPAADQADPAQVVRILTEGEPPAGVEPANTQTTTQTMDNGPTGSGGGTAPHPTVLIDPGHGGSDTGAIGIGGAREKDYTLDIALRIKSRLEMNGVTVIMSRAEDRTLALSSRTDLSNASSIDAFVSVHINAAPKTGATGLETYYREGDSASKALAADIHGSVLRQLGVADRKLKNGNWLWVIKKTSAPAVLVEYLFITTAADARILQQEQKRQDMSDATANGILRYLAGEAWGSPDSPPVPGLPLPSPSAPPPLVPLTPAAGF